MPDDSAILSVFKPELFFDWRGDRLLARPMKGTAPRGATPAEDAAQSGFLRTAAKERAENLMIVDLLRNDLSRLAEPHSVRVPRLFHTEAWPTVWQMSSDVVARTRAGTTLADVFAALFPCGSITGAPKVQAMRLINALEPEPRGIYCGAIGVVQPGGAATFNVPIRTLALRGLGDAAQVRCGIGSGITADATADGEWNEWRHKRAFVDRASQAFELLETLRLEDGAFIDVEAHLARMEEAVRVTSRSLRRWNAFGALPRSTRLRAAHVRRTRGACACSRTARASRARRRSRSRPRSSPCGCGGRIVRWRAATASSCASRPRVARTTTRSRRRRPARSTRCCGTSAAS